MSFERRFGPSQSLLWRVFLINAAMLTAATLALAFSPATVSFPIVLTEGLILGGGLAATLALDLLVLRRALGAALAPAVNPPVADAAHWPTILAPAAGAFPAPTRPAGRAARVPEHDVGTRLLVGWSQPYHLSDADAEAWTRAESTRVLAVAGAERARLTRLRSASLRYYRPWDWLLEIGAAPDSDIRHCVESPACRELLDDLRLLGTGPAAMVADPVCVLSGGRG
jgi:hypothetical protein